MLKKQPQVNSQFAEQPLFQRSSRQLEACIVACSFTGIAWSPMSKPVFPTSKRQKMFSSDDIEPDQANLNDETRKVETELHKRRHAPLDCTLLNPSPSERGDGVHRETESAEARARRAVPAPPDSNTAGDGHVSPLSDQEHSLSVDPVVPPPEEVYSLVSAGPASYKVEVVLPEGNIGSITDLIRRLPASDPGWNSLQRAIYKYLASLAPMTIQKAALRLRRCVIVGAGALRPGTRGSRRTAVSGLRIGAMLNALHPNRAISSYWTKRCEISDFPMPLDAIIGIENGGGGPIFESEQSEPRRPRRRRLKQLPDGWFEESLRATENAAPRLRAGHLILALSGCRTCEVANTRVELDIATRRITLFIPIAKQKEAAKKDSLRQLSFRATGDNEQPVEKLIQILAADDTIANGVPAKSLQNLIARTSSKLWPKLVPGLNSYCYRNLLIADLKRDGVAREQIANLLGHTTTKTASMYGTWGQGRKQRRGYLELPSDSDTDQDAINTDGSRPRPAG